MEVDFNYFIFQQEETPPHAHMDVQNYLNTHLSWRWTSCAGANYIT